jgi:hypothetical protein
MVRWEDFKYTGENDSFTHEGYAGYSVENTGTVNVTLNENTLLTPGQERVFPYFICQQYEGIVRLTWAATAGTKSITLRAFRIEE